MEFNGSGGLAGFNPFGGAPDTYAANNAAYNANQGYVSQAGMYNPFTQSGGFGAMTDYYSGLGAAYGRNTGGFGGYGGNNDPYSSIPGANPSGAVQRGPDLPNISPTPDPFRGMSSADMATWSRAMQAAGRGSEIPTSFADRYSAAPAIDYRLQPTPAQQLPQGIYDGVFNSTTPRPVIGTPTPEQPDPMTGVPIMNASRGYVGTGGQGTSWGGASSGPLAGMSAADTATWLRTMQGAGRGDEANNALAQFGGASPSTFGYPGSGNLADTPYGQGGIGSDTSRDKLAWTMAQSSPFATAGAPANGPYPNLGYNPGMANYFAFGGGGGGSSFQDRFGMGFPNAGTPSQYTASPYTNAQGQTFQPNLPPGFQQQFNADNPNGALNAVQQDTWTNRS